MGWWRVEEGGEFGKTEKKYFVRKNCTKKKTCTASNPDKIPALKITKDILTLRK